MPLWITENGLPDQDTADALADEWRVAFLRTHLEALGAALADGADVRRWLVWSLLDSFEWELGYDVRFGLVHVDFRDPAPDPQVQRSLVPRRDRGDPPPRRARVTTLRP